MKNPSRPGPEAYRFHEREWDGYQHLTESFEWEVPEQFNIATYICDRWAADRGRVAVFAEDAEGRTRTYTFWQLRNAANSLANALAEDGIGPGDRVGINVPQKPETVIAHLAVWKLGAVSIPLSTLFGPQALQFRLDDAGASAVVVDATNLESFRSVGGDVDSIASVFTVDAQPRAGERDFHVAISEHSQQFETEQTHAEDDATLIYTSGTTGPPKGVLHAHRVLLGHLPGYITAHCGFEIADADLIWSPAEWSWIATVFGTVAPSLYHGMPVLAYHDDGPFDPEAAFDLVERYGISVFFAPPTALRLMMERESLPDRYELDSVRVIFSGGEPLEPRIATWAATVFDGATVQEVYGQTEANITVGECHALFPGRDGSLGRPTPGHEVRLVDPDTAEATVEPGEVGEIAVRYENDPVCFKRYWNRPDATRRTVRNGWLLTGDLATEDADGYLSFVSRKDDVITSAGYRIGPGEIEDSLSNHPAVLDAGVVGAPDDERGEVPVAFVVLADGYQPTEDLEAELAQYVKDQLAKYEYPRRIEFLEELPRTTTGKVRRVELEERLDDTT